MERNPTEGTPQDHLESWLVGMIERVWPAYEARGKLEARMLTASRSALRGMVSRWTERRSPPIPAGRLAWNIRALDSLIALAKRDGVRILIYKPPHHRL